MLSPKELYDSGISLELLSKSIVDNVESRLEKVFNLVEFKRIMFQNHAVITGSFLQQCILGETWEDSDIDICYPRCSQCQSSLEDYFSSFGIECPPLEDDYDVNFSSKVKRYNIKGTMVEVMEFWFQDTCIFKNSHTFSDVLQFHRDFLDENAEVSISRNFFTWDEDGNAHYHFKNIEGILNKRFKLNNDKINASRLPRYYRRGYIFD
jgi:hypothetical protein